MNAGRTLWRERKIQVKGMKRSEPACKRGSVHRWSATCEFQRFNSLTSEFTLH